MTYINPLAPALSQSFSTQQELSADKIRGQRARQIAPRDVAAQTDQFEHKIESPEQASPIHDEARQKRQSRNRRQRRLHGESTEEHGEPAHIDLKA